MIEPHTATVKEKLAQLQRLHNAHIKMIMRCDPLIHGVTDSEKQIDELFAATAKTGCKEMAISFLFLRPAITRSLKQNIKDKALLNKILKPYSKSIQLSIGMKSSIGVMLPTVVRKTIVARIRKIAENYKFKVHFCGCKNHDIIDENCHIVRENNLQGHLFAT